MSIVEETFRRDFGERLRKESERLGFSQQALADLSFTSREMIGRYERGAVQPGVQFLNHLCTVRFDPLFLLTGERANQSRSLSDSERTLLGQYRAAEDASKYVIEETVAALAAKGRRATK